MSSAATPGRRKGKAPDRLQLGAFLPYRLSVLAAVVSDGLARIYDKRFGISVREWRVVATLGEFRSMTAKAIATHAHMSDVMVSRAVAALKMRGLVARSANPEDLREAFLVLTASGNDIYRRIAPLALDYAEQLTFTLSDEEKKALDRVVDKLTRRAKDMPAGRG
jgi:DNA-binding MarR family transcriptional regulator